MNSVKLLSIAKKYNGNDFTGDTVFSFSGLTTNLQHAGPSTVAFYRITDASGQKLFSERLSRVDPACLVLNKELAFKSKTPYIVIRDEDLEAFTDELLGAVYPVDSKIKIIGITGTNGKSTCVSLCEQLVVLAGKKAAALGTIGLTVNGKERDLKITGTTPSYIDLRRILNSIQSEVDYLFMEISSHAIIQNRLGKLKLHAAGWTSFSQDHLDYHKTMKEYFRAKAQIVNYLSEPSSRIVFPSSEADLKVKMNKYLDAEKKSYKVIEAIRLSERGVNLKTPFFKVHYNISNLELSLELLSEEINISAIDFDKLTPPKGRFSIIELSGRYVIIDYAHTPDAIENLASATRKAFPKAKITTLFGCGGDRDKLKRPLMARAAESFSDSVIITTDNPRSEVPIDIINDIKAGLTKSAAVVEVDRKKAILHGITLLGNGDVLIIAGKGHEEYQEVKGEKIFFSDFEIVKKARDKKYD